MALPLSLRKWEADVVLSDGGPCTCGPSRRRCRGVPPPSTPGCRTQSLYYRFFSPKPRLEAEVERFTPSTWPTAWRSSRCSATS